METVNATIKGRNNQVWAHVKNVIRENDWVTGAFVLVNAPKTFLSTLQAYSDLINDGVLSLLDEQSEKLLDYGATFQFENRLEEYPINDFYLDGSNLSVKLGTFFPK